MTEIRRIYEFAQRINSGDIVKDMETASAIIDEIAIIDDYLKRGDIELAEGHATHIMERDIWTGEFAEAFDKYMNEPDIVGLVDDYKQIIGGYNGILVMVKSPAMDWRVLRLPNDDYFTIMQAIVGGWIEECRSDIPGTAILCNEEGRLYHMPMHEAQGKVWSGTIILVGDGGDEYCGLTKEQIEAELNRSMDEGDE